MIRSRYNLVCPKGHKHYSPTPEYFVGRACFQPTSVNDTKRKCYEPLALLKPLAFLRGKS